MHIPHSHACRQTLIHIKQKLKKKSSSKTVGFNVTFSCMYSVSFDHVSLSIVASFLLLSLLMHAYLPARAHTHTHTCTLHTHIHTHACTLCTHTYVCVYAERQIRHMKEHSWHVFNLSELHESSSRVPCISFDTSLVKQWKEEVEMNIWKA